MWPSLARYAWHLKMTTSHRARKHRPSLDCHSPSALMVNYSSNRARSTSPTITTYATKSCNPIMTTSYVAILAFARLASSYFTCISGHKFNGMSQTMLVLATNVLAPKPPIMCPMVNSNCSRSESDPGCQSRWTMSRLCHFWMDSTLFS